MMLQRTLSRAVFALGMTAAVAGTAGSATAQDVDQRWLPWMGCWAPSVQGQDQDQEVQTSDLVCLRPAQQAGAVELVRLSGDETVSREVLWADGRQHDTSRESCTGWERGTFSQDGRRLFLNGEYTCDGMTQETAGIIAMESPVSWLDIRTAGVDGKQVAWVQHLVAADAASTEAAGFGDVLKDRGWSASTARMVAAASLDVDDVIEASHNVPDEAVMALLAERGDPFELNSEQLVRMADSGVSEDVIDVAVAVSYPDRFQLANGQVEPVTASALDSGSLRRRWGYAGFMSPAFYDPFYSPWSFRLGYYGYNGYMGYGSYGYGGYYGYPYGYGGYRPTVIVVDPVGGSSSHGRVINGRGFSRGRTSGSSGGGSYAPSSGSGRTAAPRGGARPSSGGSASKPSSSRGSSTGRTAKRRGGGLF